MYRMTSGIFAAALAIAPATALARPDDAQNQKQQQDQDAQETDTFEWSASSGPRLGIVVFSLTPELRMFYGATSDHGVLVARVAPRSPAARAGLRVGDALVAVRGDSVSDSDEILDALSNLTRSEVFSLTVIRDHKIITLQATISRPAEAQPPTPTPSPPTPSPSTPSPSTPSPSTPSPSTPSPSTPSPPTPSPPRTAELAEFARIGELAKLASIGELLSDRSQQRHSG